MKYKDMPPHAPTLIESTRAIGYSIETAIADIIDNSITAGSTTIDIDFFPIGEAYIAILDNGKGMTQDELISAMQYGSKCPGELRNQNDLGRYGLGMKTASLSQCRVLTVISKADERINGCRWDLDHVKLVGSWSLILLENDELQKMPCFDRLCRLNSGTLVIWQGLDKFSVGEIEISKAFEKKMTLIREHVSLVFHRFLGGETGLNKMEIRMNGLKVDPKDPFLKYKSTQIMDDESISIRGEKVRVKPFLLPHVSKLTSEELRTLGGKDGLRKQQGFYVYRNKRLLVWGTWFRLATQGEFSKLARVQVDIPNSLDDLWTLDIKKSIAIPPEEVKRNLAIILDRISESSKRTWTYRGKKETSDSVVHLWNRVKTREGAIVYNVNNDHILVSSIIKSYPELRNSIYTLLDQISTTLPVNSLFIDMTNDEKMEVDSVKTENEVISIAIEMIRNSKCAAEIEALLETFKNTEPFSSCFNEIENQVFGKGETR